MRTSQAHRSTSHAERDTYTHRCNQLTIFSSSKYTRLQYLRYEPRPQMLLNVWMMERKYKILNDTNAKLLCWPFTDTSTHKTRCATKWQQVFEVGFYCSGFIQGCPWRSSSVGWSCCVPLSAAPDPAGAHAAWEKRWTDRAHLKETNSLKEAESSFSPETQCRSRWRPRKCPHGSQRSHHRAVWW